MKQSRRSFLKASGASAAGMALAATAAEPAKKAGKLTFSIPDFSSTWSEHAERVWIGPEYWANRLQDWRLANDRIECAEGRPENPMRTVHFLTRRLNPVNREFKFSVQLGVVEPSPGLCADSAAGLLIGAGGDKLDYHAAALVHHAPGPGGGWFFGLSAGGQLFIRDFETANAAPLAAKDIPGWVKSGRPLTLTVSAKPEAENTCTLTAALADETGKTLLEVSSPGFEFAKLAGSIALVSHPGSGPVTGRFWFRQIHLSGNSMGAWDIRRCGPILSAQYTVHQRVMKMTVQMMPLGAKDPKTVALQIRAPGALNYQSVGSAAIIEPGCTAHFRVANWDTNRDIEYRLVYSLEIKGGTFAFEYRDGLIPKEPKDKDSLVVASLSCVQQVGGQVGGSKDGTFRWVDRVWFPHADMTPNLARQKPDLYFFAGDQIYEGNPTRVVKQPLPEAELDYLYKWYLWCWAYRDLIKDAPTITIPDDHDVYHGNIWGGGGKAAAADDPQGLLGGYSMPASWLNMMQRTQCSHLPDPVDPAPAEQGIKVYFTSLVWGGVGFAILEDRKFKSFPSVVKAEKTRDSHITEKNFDTRKADVPDAQLLGERQEKFLRNFAQDWRDQVMKAALSQTIFCNLQISSRPPNTGELDKDLDSNGWPQSGRRRALHEMRRGFMIHLAGDQHLASAIRHGIDEYEDANWSLCSPAVANLYIRYWNPDYPPADPQPGRAPFLGRYEDGFHNKLAIYAVANPVEQPKPGQFPEPMELHRKAPGYALVRFNKAERTITLEVWPRYVNPLKPETGSQYPGWPITVRQLDNYGRAAVAWLPTLKFNRPQPVVQIIDETDQEIVYTLRISGSDFRPKVFRKGRYTVKAGDGAQWLKTMTGVEAVAEGEAAVLAVNF